MQTSDAVRERRSIRAFTDQPVERNAVERVLELARYAPSWANAQDWSVFAVTGESLERIKERVNIAAGNDEEPEPDIAMPERESWPEHMLQRMALPAPAPADDAPPPRPALGDLYGAPWLLLFAVDERLEPHYAFLDTGLLIQTVCLVAEDRGLNTCIMARAARYAQILHAEIPEAAGKKFVVGVALGYLEPGSRANRGRRERVDLDEIVTWLE